MKKMCSVSSLIFIALLYGCDSGEATETKKDENVIEVTSDSEMESKEEIFWNELSNDEKETKVKELINVYGVNDMFKVSDLIEELNVINDESPINMALDFEPTLSNLFNDSPVPGMIEALPVNEQLGNDSYTDLDKPINEIYHVEERDGKFFVFFDKLYEMYMSVSKDNTWIVKDQSIHMLDSNPMYGEEIKGVIKSTTEFADITYRFSNDSIFTLAEDDDLKTAVLIESNFDDTGITGSKIISQDYVVNFFVVDTLDGDELFWVEKMVDGKRLVDIYEDTSLSNPVYSFNPSFKDYRDISKYTERPFLDKDRNYVYLGDEKHTIKIDITTGEPDWDAQGQLIEYDIPYSTSYFIGDDFGLIVASDIQYEEEIKVARYDYNLNMMNEALYFEGRDFDSAARTEDELRIFREVEFKDVSSIQMTPFSID